MSDGLAGIQVAGWVSEGVALGRADFENMRYFPGQHRDFKGIPAIINFDTGLVSPIRGFIDGLNSKAGGPVPLVVDRDSFLRVEPEGGCLNVRDTPSTESTVIACFPEGVLLSGRANVGAIDGWTPVTTPRGQPGWAASRFLAEP